MLTVKDLELVRAVARLESLTAAAESLHISQSAASQRLKTLNDRLDTDVFDRRSGRLELTAAGQRLLTAANVVTGEIDATLRDLNNLMRHQRDALRITTQCYTCYRWLPFVIRSMTTAFPQLTVDVVPEATERPYEALAEKEIDLAIVSNPAPASTFETHDLFSDELYAVLNTQHTLAARKILSPRDFSNQSLILYTGKRHAIVDAILAPANVKNYELIQVRITEAVIELARAGRGIAVIAGWALDDIDDKEDLVAVRITRRGFKRTWRAVVAGPKTPPVEHFLQQLCSIGQTLQHAHWRSRVRAEINA